MLIPPKLPNRSAAETEFFLDEVRNGSETLHVSAEDADALFQKAQAFAEAIGITPPVIQSANESGRTIPVSANRLIAVSAQKPEYREYQKDVLSTARFSSTGLNLEEAQNLDISEESQKKSAERYEYRSAARELADQLKSEGRSQAEINSFLFMANIGTYIGAHNRAGISASEWLRKIVFKAARTGNMQEMAELFQVSNIWTGSAANYDQPSLQYVGTGEGAQVYGWGLYGSDQEGIARHYADADARRRQQVKLYFDGAELDENGDVHYLDAPNARSPLEDILPDSRTRKRILADLRLMLTNDYYTNQRNPAKRILEDMHAHQIRIHGINDPISIQIGRLLNLKSIHRRLKHTVQRIEGNRNLYRQTFWADKEENLLLWNKDVPEKQIRQIIDAAGGLLTDSDMARHEELTRKDFQNEITREEKKELAALDRRGRIASQRHDKVKGSSLYSFLTEEFGSPQKASKFLYRAGIDGVKYPAGSQGTGDGSKGWNYVAFSDKDIRVDEHIMFQTAPDSQEPSEIFDEHGDWTEKGAVAWYEKLVKAAERFAERTKQSGLVLDEAGLIAAAETALRNAAKGYNPEAGQFEAYAGKAVKNAFISAARSAGRRNVATASLQEETGTGEDARTLEDRTADPDAASADEIMTEAETAERLTAALETLTEKERQVWDMAQADRGRGYITRIAETLGVSKTNVSKLYNKAEAKMKAAAADPDAVKQKTAEPAVSETVAAAQAAEPVSEAAAPEQPVEKKVPYIPSDAKGMFRETPDFGGMIFLFENADATTVVHEMAHAAMETMRRMIAAGIADERMESDFAALEEWAKLDPASAAKQYTAYTQRMEKFAEGVSQIFPEYTRVKPRSTA